jgi:hypothetical protein
MTQKLMTAAVIAALVLTVVAAAREPILRNQTASPAPHPAELPPVPNAGSGDKELAGYRDPHARTRNISTQTVSSCWVRTRYGTVNVCETDGRGD